jgi:phenylacetate-coenzyme A ligase PaaK-like adenylate-forming protein
MDVNEIRQRLEHELSSTLSRLRSDLKRFLNLSPELTVLKEGELPRPPGKSVRVVDRR